MGPSMSLTRTYRSMDTRNGPIGRGWSMSFDQRLIETTDEVSLFAICRNGDGTRERYVSSGAGSYTTPPYGTASLVKRADGTFTLSAFDGSQRRFDTNGRLT